MLAKIRHRLGGVSLMRSNFLVPSLDKRHITIVAGVLGVLVAFITRTGVLHALEIPVQFDYVDYLITGVLISRGANIVHDLAKTLNLAS